MATVFDQIAKLIPTEIQAFIFSERKWALPAPSTISQTIAQNLHEHTVLVIWQFQL